MLAGLLPLHPAPTAGLIHAAGRPLAPPRGTGPAVPASPGRGLRGDRFFRPPYVGHRGWLGVYLDVPVDWDEIADLVTAAYCRVAPKRLVAEVEARGG